MKVTANVSNTVPDAIHFVPEVRSATLDRPRLRLPLPAAGGQTRLVVVEGPAGSGKTTALAQWARAGGHGADALVWVTLHDGDRDRVTFWNRILTTIQDAGIAPEGSFLERLDPTTLQRPTLRSSLVRAFSSLHSQLFLVIDDFHIVNDPRIDEDIRTAVECSANVAMVIASRSQSSLSDVQTASRLDTKVLDTGNFAFTLEETIELMVHHGHSESSLAAAIFSATNGWPLATRAMLVEADRSGSNDVMTVELHSNFIGQYVDSVLKHATTLEWELLLATSVCNDFTVALAAELCNVGTDAVGEALAQLETAGVTTAKQIRGTTHYDHHPALGTALLQRAEELLPSEKMRSVRLHYAAWIEANRPDVALTLLCSLGALDLAQAALARNFATLTSIYAESCQRALAGIPMEATSVYPALLSARLLIEHANPAVPLAWLEKCFSLIMDGVNRVWGDGTEPGFPELTLLAGMHHMMGDGETAAQLAASTAIHLLDPESPQIRPVRASVPLAHAVVAITNMLNGNYAVAAAHYELCRRDAEGLGQAFEVARGVNGSALVAALSGDAITASRHVSTAELSVRERDWQGHFGATNLHIAKAWIAVEDFDTATVCAELDALHHVEEVMELWPLASIARAQADLQSKGAKSASLNLKDAIARKNTRPKPVREQRLALVKLQADLAIMGGGLREAAAILEEVDTDHWGLQVSKARLLLAQGDNVAASSIAAVAATAVQNSQHRDHHTFAGARLIQATAAWHLGQEEPAVEIATALVARLNRLGLRTPLLGVPLTGLTELFAAVDAKTDAGALFLLTGLPDVHGTSAAETSGISVAERSVLKAINLAGSVEAASNELFLSTNTVKSHLRRIYRKLGVNTRREALARAAEAGLLEEF